MRDPVHVDPHAIEDFEKYATTWPAIIERCGGELTGYYLPKEGANDWAIALIDFESLAEPGLRASTGPGWPCRPRRPGQRGVRSGEARAILAERRSFLHVRFYVRVGVPGVVPQPMASRAVRGVPGVVPRG